LQSFGLLIVAHAKDKIIDDKMIMNQLKSLNCNSKAKLRLKPIRE